MPSGRRNNRPRPQQQVFHSDYESDVPPPNSVPLRTNADLNLSVLLRHFPDITTILSIAPFAVIYKFNITHSSWEKVDIEGTLFVCAQAADPTTGSERYCVVVLNRRGLDNFSYNLAGKGKEVEITDDYVILQDGQSAMGIWIFSDPEKSTAKTREINSQAIKECAERAEASRLAIEERERQQQLANAIHRYGSPISVQAEGGAGGAPQMVRTLSIREMLGKQREEDDAWSIKSHSPQVSHISQLPSQLPAALPPGPPDQIHSQQQQQHFNHQMMDQQIHEQQLRMQQYYPGARQPQLMQQHQHQQQQPLVTNYPLQTQAGNDILNSLFRKAEEKSRRGTPFGPRGITPT
ncbi:MAG: hypothetical protein M1834_000217 [Cirrosporium novae-zelandiae]|nr:MAG: hypothetical protein M1834_000217 [Cirrosporium novae-zelandiae]